MTQRGFTITELVVAIGMASLMVGVLFSVTFGYYVG
jgi:prepilin-type N-terminal cleavage/methylation domain-containing protein